MLDDAVEDEQYVDGTWNVPVNTPDATSVSTSVKPDASRASSVQDAPVIPAAELSIHCVSSVSYTHLTLPTICSV